MPPFLDEMTTDELLEEIIQKKGPYKRDRLDHATSCLDHASSCAKRIKEILGTTK